MINSSRPTPGSYLKIVLGIVINPVGKDIADRHLLAVDLGYHVLEYRSAVLLCIGHDDQ